MKDIRDRLKSIKGDPQIIVSDETVLRKSDILINPAELRNCIGARIGICYKSPASAIVALAALDGVADLLLIVPPHIEGLHKFASTCELDAILCDEMPVDTSGLPEFFHSVEELPKEWRHKKKSLETQWCLATSGTTGNPKLVCHTFSSLTRTINTKAQDGVESRWGLLYEHTRFAGMQVILQSLCSGAFMIAPDAAGSMRDKMAQLAKHKCTHLSATPTLWRKLLLSDAINNLNLKQITLGGEIADNLILTALRKSFPAARITHIYASTEAGVGFSVKDGIAGFPTSFLTDPPSGIEIRIEDDLLLIRTHRAARAYLGTSQKYADEEGWVNTGDIVKVNGDRVLFRGRVNGIINVGGDKIHPEEVEQILCSHPMVSAARVYARNNPITGSIVAADIVLREQNMSEVDAKEKIVSYARQNLGRSRAPALVRFVANLESQFTGKIQRT